MALVARHLDLLEHAWRQHMFLDDHAPSATLVTSNHLPVRGPRPLTRLADLLLFDAEMKFPAHVEIPQRDPNPYLHIRSATVARRMSEMATTTEESREQIKRVIRRSTGRASLSVIIQSFVPVLVVDLARCRRGQNIVGFCDLDEFLACRFVAPVLAISLSLYKQRKRKTKEERTGSYPGETFYSTCDTPV